MALVLIALAALSFVSSPVAAQQLETFDPDEAFAEETSEGAASPASTGAIDADLVEPASPTARPLPTTQPLPVAGPLPGQEATPEPSAMGEEFAIYSEPPVEGATPSAETAGAVSETAGQPARTAMAEEETFAEDDLIGAAEGVFGKGAEGLAKMIEGLLKKEGRPNGYIVGREAGGAFVVGARYGSGTLHHKVEGERKVYWTGPSVGFDAGANAGNTFVLVYNLWDSEDLFKRYPAGEGQAYFVGGLHASYVRRGDVVLIPIRMGAGVRLGVNAGYMRFSKKQRWLPF
ncbi:MAG: EipA family protein [Pseudomonadota bacterium]